MKNNNTDNLNYNINKKAKALIYAEVLGIIGCSKYLSL